jgi:predicted lipopolysaccharide heptosyltransferase III
VKILLVRLRLIGDVVFTTPAIAALRQQFPGARISYLVERAAAPVVERNPHLDEVIVADKPQGVARLRYDVALARRLRNERFDIVIDFHGGPRSAWLTRATGAARRIGYNLPGRRWAYTIHVPWTRALVPPRHSVLNQCDLLQPLGVTLPAMGTPAVEMPADQMATASIAERLRQAGTPETAPVAVVHVSASSPFRRWPAERFAEVAARLLEQHRDLRIVFTAGPDEQRLRHDVIAMTAARATSHAARVLRGDDVDLRGLRALIERASIYIGGDSGPLHIAATTCTPIVALFGPTVPQRSLPWRSATVPSVAVDAGPLPCRPCDQRHCVPGDYRCLTGVGVEQVVTAASQLLGSSR